MSKLCSLFWEAVTLCEINNTVIHAVVADGASTNRKFFNLIHGERFKIEDHHYTAPNPHHDDYAIFLISDTSHLLKVGLQLGAVKLGNADAAG